MSTYSTKAESLVLKWRWWWWRWLWEQKKVGEGTCVQRSGVWLGSLWCVIAFKDCYCYDHNNPAQSTTCEIGRPNGPPLMKSTAEQVTTHTCRPIFGTKNQIQAKNTPPNVLTYLSWWDNKKARTRQHVRPVQNKTKDVWTGAQFKHTFPIAWFVGF